MLAKLNYNETLVSGRYIYQENLVGDIVDDLVKKLNLKKGSNLLDIGCGVGMVTIPLSKNFNNVTCIDNKYSLEIFKKKTINNKKFKFISGNFLKIPNKKISRKFENILVYSVLQLLENDDEVFKFIDKSLKLLEPGGKLLIGDVTNDDKKKRFLDSNFGKKFSKEWEKKLKSEPIESRNAMNELGKDKECVRINDKLILSIATYFRKKKYEVFILNQDNNLPFGRTREDILFIKLD